MTYVSHDRPVANGSFQEGTYGAVGIKLLATRVR